MMIVIKKNCTTSMDTIYNLEKNLQSSESFHSFFQALMYIDKNDSFPKEFSPLS